MVDNSWSADANAATKAALLAEVPGTAALMLHCKHIAGGFGTIKSIHSDGTIEVTKSDDGVIIFPTIDAFIQGGWTID